MTQTKLTAALTWRCCVATAARGYSGFLTEDNPLQMLLWGGIYKTDNIKAWARERVNGILVECARLWPLFADDEELVRLALDAAREPLESLERLGWSEVVPGGETGS